MKQVSSDLTGIALTVQSIKNGEVVIFPTDTVYGIGCNPYDENAVDRVYRLKKRNRIKPLPILGYSKYDLESIVKFDDITNRITDKFWPGQLTIVLPLIDDKLKKLSGGLTTLAVRVPNNKCTLSLLKECKLIIGTSANISGDKPLVDPQNYNNIISKCDIFLNGGIINNSNESTIVEIVDKKIRILRKGVISEKKIVEAV